MVDIVDVRTAIKNGELRTYIKERNVFVEELGCYKTQVDIYLQDCQNRETVLIGTVEHLDVERIISMHEKLARKQ